MITDDYQLMFEDYYSGDMITLGGGGDFCSVRFDGIGSAELRASERDMPSEDGATFGQEYLGKRNWTIQGAIKSGTNSGTAGTSDGAWDSLSMLMRAWDYNRARLLPRAVLPLYFKRPGRELMVVYGRPERIDPDVTQSYAGFVTYQATFRQSDPKFYADATENVTLSSAQATEGGILLRDYTQDSLTMTNAFLLPFTAVGSVSSSPGGYIQQGDVPAPVVFTFEVTSGTSVTNPTLELRGTNDAVLWRVTLATTVLYGQTVTVNPNLWERSVLRNDGASLAGAYRGPRMAELLVPPGPVEFVYTGTNVGGGSSCSITLRDAWTAI